ncbi:ATPase get3 [Tolypocladium ophioglossoides CBS 100239]|uniref:ATPase get3 n=1 Tax=Tolypocladium ophioglossoides (strain CBS 100239) TaxID=1163406 RepID=A0A0L0N523_TOLOC|nr:ATPase get3 [Tolypocladium ophioglossoides CBS 100239]
MADVADDIVNAYSSSRLRYIRADASDPLFKAFIPQIEQDPVIQAFAASTMLQPKSARHFESYAESVASSLLGVAVCLLPQKEEERQRQEEVADLGKLSLREKNEVKKKEKEPTIIGVMCLGWGGISPAVAHHRTAPIGISLAKQYQNKGYGREAIKWMLDWAFKHAGLHSVSISSASFNPRENLHILPLSSLRLPSTHRPLLSHSLATNTMSSSALISADDALEPTLQSLLDQRSLRWIFVGGKGGVGKTTTSCSLAIQLARVRRSVLLISTDPAHNLSDAFSQKFGKEARLVDGFDNLSAMEIDPNGSMQDLLAGQADGAEDMNALGGWLGGMMQDLAFAIPGIDEAMSFAEVLKQVKSLSYETIVFDTAPTGHTLRFLQFPSVLEKALAKVSQLSSQYGPLLNGFLGSNGALPNGQNLNDMMEKLESLRETISEVNTQFKDAELTTFVCVCIAEFLSLYETERMIQELASYGIDTHSIVVNQLLFPKKASECDQCNARRKMQKKYLDQYEELYAEDFNVV